MPCLAFLSVLSILSILALARPARATVCLTSPDESAESLLVPLRGLQAYLKVGKIWTRVAIQIDERDSNGDYVLEHGLPFTADGGDGRFNGSDELVIDLPENFSDAQAISEGDTQTWLKGLQKKTPLWPPAAARRSKVWRLDLTVGTKKVQVLLVSGLPEKLLPDAVWFNSNLQTVESPTYRYHFNKRNPASMGRLEIPEGNAKTQDFTTINSDGAFAIWVKPPWGFPVISKSDKDLVGAIESWRSGPVRTIVAVGSKYNGFWSIIKAHLFSELVFYRNRFQIPSVIEIPFSPKKLVGSGSGFAYALRLSGQVVPKLESPDNAPATVFVEHPAGLILTATLDPALTKAGTLPKVWQSENSNENSGIPEDVVRWFRENEANTGFFVDISQMGRGRYDFSLDLESRGRANKVHTDFQTCKSVWTPMAPTQTVRPATKPM